MCNVAGIFIQRYMPILWNVYMAVPKDDNVDDIGLKRGTYTDIVYWCAHKLICICGILKGIFKNN